MLRVYRIDQIRSEIDLFEYYGTADIFKWFLTVKPLYIYIYYDVVKNPSPAPERIEYLERNHPTYRECLSEPVLAHGEKIGEKR